VRFLLDANMPRSAVSVLERNGHDAVHARDTALKDAPDERIADFADVRRYAPEGSPGYLVRRVPDSCIASEIVELMERFLDMPGLADQIPGHLVILDPRQVRFRPAVQSEVDGKR
jgi:hypothetical protein